MRKIKIIGTIMRLLTGVLIGGLISFWPRTSNGENATPPELCREIQSLVALPVPHGGRSISFSVKEKTVWGTKTCRAVPNDAAGMGFCKYVSSHTSFENLAPNISRLIACLETGGRPAHGAQILTEKMLGKFRVFEPFNLKNVDVEFEYFYTSAFESPDSFSLVVINRPDD